MATTHFVSFVNPDRTTTTRIEYPTRKEADKARTQLRKVPGLEQVVSGSDSPMVTRINMMTGKEYQEREDTPGFMSPASEAYWSM